MSRRWSWAKQWNAQGGLCWICLLPMKRGNRLDPLAPSRDHIVPKVRGGGQSWRNKLLAHRSCNSKRGAPFIWIPLRRFRREAMLRISARLLLHQSAQGGVDPGCSHPTSGAPERHGQHLRPVTMPSEMAGKALRVTLGELSSQHQSNRRS